MLCKLAYPHSIDHVALGYAVDGYAEISNHRQQVIARILWQHDKKEVVVVFRGSQSIGDWLINLCCLPRRKCFKTPISDSVTAENSNNAPEPNNSFNKEASNIASAPKYYVHWGYDHLLNQRVQKEIAGVSQSVSIYQQIQAIVEPLIAQGKRISLTGHSSGGAMAILAADRLERQFPRAIKRVVTFGQPAAGFRSFKRHYLLHLRTYRICCDLDIITFLPPLPGVFVHVGRSLWLHNERIYENIVPALRLYKTLVSWVISPISYHYMHKYIRNKDFFDKH